MFDLQKITKQYNGRSILNIEQLTINHGEILALVLSLIHI